MQNLFSMRYELMYNNWTRVSNYLTDIKKVNNN